jgi:putative membrane fusion protein
MERRTARNRVIKNGLIFIAALICLGVIYKFGVSLQTALIKFNRHVEMATRGTIEDKLTAKAVIINNEEVAYASSPGQFENLVKEKEKVGRQTLLGYYLSSAGKTQIRANKSGIFVRNTDGLEDALSQLDFQSVTPEVFKYKVIDYGRQQNIETGQPIYKLVDSLVPTRLLVHFPEGAADFEIKANHKVKINMAGKEVGTAVISQIKRDFGETLLLLQFNDFREQLLGLRYIEVEVLFDSLEGFMVPEKAVTENQGKKGIYCLNGEDITFKPVQILGQKDHTLVVDGLSVNDMIVTNP